MMPTPSRMTGMASVAAATAPAPPARIAALASRDRVIGFGGWGVSGAVRAASASTRFGNPRHGAASARRLRISPESARPSASVHYSGGIPLKA